MLTHEQQLHMLIDRWASRPGPFSLWHGEVQGVAADEPATHGDLSRYAAIFVQSLGCVYGSLHQVDDHLDEHIAACRFAFGEWTAAGKLRDVGAALVGPLIRWEGPTLLIAKPAKRYQWLQAAAILDADQVFAQLVEMGF